MPPLPPSRYLTSGISPRQIRHLRSISATKTINLHLGPPKAAPTADRAAAPAPATPSGGGFLSSLTTGEKVSIAAVGAGAVLLAVVATRKPRRR